MSRTMTAAAFKAQCLAIMDEVQNTGASVTITKRGKPVARLAPIEPLSPPKSIIGSMKGTVLRYDDPFSPAIDPSEWHANR